MEETGSSRSRWGESQRSHFDLGRRADHKKQLQLLCQMPADDNATDDDNWIHSQQSIPALFIHTESFMKVLESMDRPLESLYLNESNK